MLGDYSQIPLEVQKAFEFVLPGLVSGATSTGSFVQANIRRTIAVSGDPENISVLEDPAGYISVKFAGATYKVPFWVE